MLRALGCQVAKPSQRATGITLALALIAVVLLGFQFMRAEHPTAHSVAAAHAAAIAGQTYVVTGATSGIGLETARVLALHGATVITGTRSSRGAAAAVELVNAEASLVGSAGRLLALPLDLASLKSVDAFADTVKRDYPRGLAGLVANAGRIAPEFSQAEGGLEQTWTVNHLSHQHLICRLTDRLLQNASNPGRVVMVSSWHGAVLFTAGGRLGASTQATYSMFSAYGDSKLANVRTARELQRRYGHRGLAAFSVHPGFVHTALGTLRGESLHAKIQRAGAWLFWEVIMAPWTKSIGQGAATQIKTLVAPIAELNPGGFHSDARPSAIADPWFARDPESVDLDRELFDASSDAIQSILAGRRAGAQFQPTPDYTSGSSSMLTLCFSAVFAGVGLYLWCASLPSPTNANATTSRLDPKAMLAGLAALITASAWFSVTAATVLAAMSSVWLVLVMGLVAIPRRGNDQPTKARVFCIGLSRTGTTSLTTALQRLGYDCYHQSFKILNWSQGKPSLNSAWCDRFDAATDISAAVIYQELATAYPQAKFVLSTRDPHRWGEAMVSFMAQHRLLFRYTLVPPIGAVYRAIYGDNWDTMSPEAWSLIATRHNTQVQRFFRDRGETSRLLELDVTRDACWDKLCAFLDESLPENETFPHTDVMHLSWFIQPWWQLRNLAGRLRPSAWLWAPALVVLTMAAIPWLADFGQCQRACRVVHGQGHPEVHGRSGSWGDTWISGTKRWWDLARPETCSCYTTDRQLVSVDRYHLPQATNKQWWFRTTQVCTANRTEFATLAEAEQRGEVAINCGQCGRCSTLHDTQLLAETRHTLTRLASKAAILMLLIGRPAAELYFSWAVGFTPQCSLCWLENMQCTIAHCSSSCIFGWKNPLSSVNNDGNGALNDCLQCDEEHCSPYFLQCAGANRRTAGVTTDIGRPASTICSLKSDYHHHYQHHLFIQP